MSLYLQTLPQRDREILLRPDVRPFIHTSWLPETSSEKEGMHTCIISREPTLREIQEDRQAPRVYQRDLEDLRRIWLTNEPEDVQILLRGYWTVEDWGPTGTECIVILQYKTLRVCVRGGSGPVVIGTSDVDNILHLCQEWTPSEEVPQCVGNLLYNNHMLQWLLLPVERDGNAGLEAYTREFREGARRAWVEPPEVTRRKILTELGHRAKEGSHGAERAIARQGIDGQDIERAMSETGPLLTGYETLHNGELEKLVIVHAAASAGTSSDPYPQPLTIEVPQTERILELPEAMMEVVEQLEDFKKEEHAALRYRLPVNQQKLSDALNRYFELWEQKKQAETRQHRGEQDPGQDAGSDVSHYYLPRDLFSGSSGPSALPQYMSTSTLDHSSNAQQANTISGGFHQLPPSGGYVSGHQRQYHGHYNNEYDGGEPSGGHDESYLPGESSLSEADPCEDEDEHDEYYNTGYGGGGSSRQRYSSQQ